MVTGELVSGNYFEGFGVGTVLGRPIEPADDIAPGGGPVAVISDAFWARRFGRSSAVIGKAVKLNLVPITIIGVAPQGLYRSVACGSVPRCVPAVEHATGYCSEGNELSSK